MQTPFLPALRAILAPMGTRTAHSLRQVRSYTLCQIEERFGPRLPRTLFPKTAQKTNSRQRFYTQWRTFWCMLWQSFNPKASGREVVRQLQALLALHGGPSLSEEDGAYCRAKGRLPLGEFPKALAATAREADQLAPSLGLLQGRRLKVADGSTLSMPDTPKNQKAYPPVHCPKPNFPMLRIVLLFSVLSGAVLSLVTGDLRSAELPMFNQLLSQLAAGDILVADRGFGNFVLLALLQELPLGIDFIGRSARHVDGRCRRQRLGHNDWLITWKKGANPSLWLPAARWLGLPAQIEVRVVRGSCYVKGFRVRQVTLTTTLLDRQQYPAEQILQAYLRRWRLEMCLDDLKTTLEMDILRGHTPEMVLKEIYTRLIAHNLIRYTMAEAALQYSVALDRISFKGTLDALRQFSYAMCQTHTKRKRRHLWDQLLRNLAADLVPQRPGRREPRAVKRARTKYPRLSKPRHIFRDRPKRETRRTLSRLRRLALM